MAIACFMPLVVLVAFSYIFIVDFSKQLETNAINSFTHKGTGSEVTECVQGWGGGH
jgi:hypothetical protein